MPHPPTHDVLVECVKLRWSYSLATFCVILRQLCSYVNKCQAVWFGLAWLPAVCEKDFILNQTISSMCRCIHLLYIFGRVTIFSVNFYLLDLLYFYLCVLITGPPLIPVFIILMRLSCINIIITVISIIIIDIIKILYSLVNYSTYLYLSCSEFHQTLPKQLLSLSVMKNIKNWNLFNVIFEASCLMSRTLFLSRNSLHSYLRTSIQHISQNLEESIEV